MKKLVFTDPPVSLLPETISQIYSLGKFEITQYDAFAIDEDELVERGRDAQVILTDLTKYYCVLREWTNLETIITPSVGVDHIDIEYCEQHNIKVINCPGYNARAVAEMTIAILIGLIRHVPTAQLYVRSGGWNWQYFEGSELRGKVFGLIGAGNVGKELIDIANGLGMELLVYTKNPSLKRAKELGIKRFSSFEEVLTNSDFVTLAIPATTETKHIIGLPELKLMKESAILINAGRGILVDTLALSEAIFERQIAGAALDVVETDPFNLHAADLRIQEMVNSNNVVVTPHIGFYTHESLQRLGIQVLNILKGIS